jgi:hypothetical protein
MFPECSLKVKEIAESGVEKEALGKKMEKMKGEFKDLEDKALVVQVRRNPTFLNV